MINANTTFGRYHIIRPLGEGGMAAVYLARDPKLDRMVALKVPNLAGGNPQVLARFRIEATAVARLEDPTIVPLYEYGDQGGQPYLVMRYMPGGSLADRIGRRVASLPEAVSVIDRIAAGLDYAHAHGVIHRDVKPGNILFDDSGAAYLADFGIARVNAAEGHKTVRGVTKAGLVPGTVDYMSPEQALGRPLDGRSDIYSLGVVLYEMLAGDIPFRADSQLQQAIQHVSAPIPSLRARRPDLPPPIQTVVERALAKDPAARYPTAGALAADLRRLARGQTPAGATHSQGKPGGVPAWLWAVGALAVIALVFFLLSSGGDPPATSQRPRIPAATPGGQTAATSPAQDDGVQAAGNPGPAENLTLSGGEGETQLAVSLPTSTPAPRASPSSLPATQPPATQPPTTAPDRGPEALTIGRTALGTPVQAVRFGAGPNAVFFIGGLHAGYSPGSVALANLAVGYFTDRPELIPEAVTLYVVISASPDTPNDPGELPGRLNSNGVDANRNWDCRWARDAKWRNQVIPGSGGTGPFSEPEVRALADFLLAEGAAAVVFWEARAPDGLVSPGNCGTRTAVSGPLATIYGAAAGYGIADFETLTDQELNGDGTNWLDSIGIPAISVLLPSYNASDWEANLQGMLAVLEAHVR